MKTRYWKCTETGVMWKLEGERMTVRRRDGVDDDWSDSLFDKEDVESDSTAIECDADGTPLSELPHESTGITLAEFDAFAARVRDALAKLEQEEAR